MTESSTPPGALPATEESWLHKLGPGLITGAADDDPSGIATYSQAGAQFGLGMLWTLLLTFPLMVGIQVISARIGRVSGHGLATNIRRHYPRWLLYAIVILLLVANTINIAADVAAMGDAAQLVLGGNAHWYSILFGVVSLLLQVFVKYNRYVRVLKWLTLALLAYVATVFIIGVPWWEVARATVWPTITWKADYITTMVAVFGTTISPYLFFWQASQEVEEQHATKSEQPLKRAPEQVMRNFRRIKIDTIIGMAFSNLVAFCIMLTTAITLSRHGIHDIQTSAQAAAALRPIAGKFAFALFSLGIIGTGLLALPVLAGSAAYAMAGAFRWDSSLEHDLKSARPFYAIISLATLGGVLLGFTGLDPIKALFWSAVVNGVISVPIMAVMMAMAVKPAIMGTLRISQRLQWLGWTCTTVMAVAISAMFVTLIR